MKCILRLILLVLAITTSSLNGISQRSPLKKLPILFINEVNVKNFSNDDFYFELVVLRKEDIPFNTQNDSPKIIIDDASDGNFTPGFLTLKLNCAEDLNQGDIIILHGENTNVANIEAKLVLNVNHDCIEKWSINPNTNSDYYLDAVPIEDQTNNLKDFIGYTGQNNDFQVRINEVYFNKIEQSFQRNYSLKSNNLIEYGDLTSSLGGANNELNQELIDDIIQQSPLSIDCEVLQDEGMVSISINPVFNNIGNNHPNFTGPYQISVG